MSSDLEIFKSTVGLILPIGTTSFTFSPQPSVLTVQETTAASDDSLSTLPADNRYLTLEGALVVDPDIPEGILVAPGGSATLGTITILGNTAGNPPTLTLAGATTVSLFRTGVEGPFIEPSGDTILDAPTQLTGTGAQGEDFDADGVGNNSDNCVFTFNPLQTNNGGFMTAIANTFGDDCECGDLDGNGQILADGSDVSRLREVVAGIVTTENSLELCSVSGSPECDIKDAIVLERALAGVPGPAPVAVCLRAIASSSGGDN
jgi:hypothetical protein